MLEVANTLKLSASTVCTMAQQGKLKAQKIGGRVYFDRVEVDRLRAERAA